MLCNGSSLGDSSGHAFGRAVGVCTFRSIIVPQLITALSEGREPVLSGDITAFRPTTVHENRPSLLDKLFVFSDGSCYFHGNEGVRRRPGVRGDFFALQMPNPSPPASRSLLSRKRARDVIDLHFATSRKCTNSRGTTEVVP